MSFKGSFIFDFFDVYGNRLDDELDVQLKHTVLSGEHRVRGHKGKKALRFVDLEGTPDGSHLLQAFPARYRPVGRFIRLLDGKTSRHAFTLPVHPARVVKVEFPDFTNLTDELKDVLDDSRLEGEEDFQGAPLYDRFDAIRRAGLLNIYTKARMTKLSNGRTVSSYLQGLTRLRGDRLFARVQKELRDAVIDSQAKQVFRSAGDSLHTPPPGFVRVDSYKTFESYGNLQLTFFNKPNTLEFMLDADIDDAQGIGHFFQVLGHFLTSGQTHPYDIHQILLGYQQIDPGYRLIV